ncbi:hypothetical protein [Mycolicibacterium bacteremicum]|uniref:hypothetical protein n=1 Tax=Mycolicibacterium bacteremicum TaxID=564198 RepID=UPI0026F31A3B|nr:hypothetical protein [Mycolicibacterium bacteremicum]
MLLVIAISVGATILLTRDSGNGTTQTASGNPPTTDAIASAGDTGPVSVLINEPTCEAWRPINDTLARKQAESWSERDYSRPASEWNTEQRLLHDDIATAMRSAADQTVALAKATPNRIVRELYEQAIAYWRAYADSIPTYTSRDNSLAGVAANASGAIVMLCAAIDYKSASARAPLVSQHSESSNTTTPDDPASPEKFINSSGNPICADWIELVNRFDSQAAPWREVDPNLPASKWTPTQAASMTAMQPVMTKLAEDIEALGNRSDSAVIDDFASLSAQYWRAFVAAIPSYTSADSYLSGTASYVNFLLFDACTYSEA